MSSLLREQLHSIKAACQQGWNMLRHQGPGQIQFWFIALGVGIASGLAAIAFRGAVEWLQTLVYGTPDVNTLHSFAEHLPWIWVLVIPVLGGIAVGLILHVATPDGRVRAVADVIEGAALNDGRVEKKRASPRRCVHGSRCRPADRQDVRGRWCISPPWRRAGSPIP